MAGPNDFDTIVTAILQQTSAQDAIVPMLVGAGLESRWRISAPGGGAFQIIDAGRYHPNGIQWKTQIDADVAYMLPRYEAAAVAHAAEPEGADKYANIAYDAERPAKKYQDSQGESTVQSIYQTVLQNYGGVDEQGSAQTKTVVGGNIGLGFLAPVVAFLGDLTDVRLWRSLGWIGLGIILLVLGLMIWLRKDVASVARSVVGG